MYSNTYKDYNSVGYCGNNAFNTTFPYLWMMNNSNHATTAETVAPVEESNDVEWGNVVSFCGIVIFFALLVYFVYLMIDLCEDNI